MKNIDRQALNYWQDREQRIIAAHIFDQIEWVREKGLTQITPFLSSAMSEWALGLIKRFKLCAVSVGGFPDAERVRLMIMPNPCEEESLEGIAIIHVTPNHKDGKIEHRQILGSLIGLGLERQVIGDIKAGKEGYYVAVTEQMGPWLEQHWHKVGREEINVVRFFGVPELDVEQGEERRITVSSSRLDGVLAAGFNLSRNKAQEVIAQGRVKVRDRVVTKQDAELLLNDKISCRGFGRMLLMEKEETRKGRIAWKVIIFRSQR